MIGTTHPHTQTHTQWFRQASPYINAHRGKTFVLFVNGQMLDDDGFPTLIHDVTLLRNLGVRLVLVHGLRPQIDRRLADLGIQPSFLQNRRLTDTPTLDAVIGEAGRARIQIEAQLSTGLPNTPMSGAHVSVASGNFITAQPVGVVDGVDFLHTGLVRQVHAETIQKQIDTGHLVLLSPLGYSRTGELFNVESEEVAMRTAISLTAEKLIFLTDRVVNDHSGQRIRECNHTRLGQTLQSLPADSPERLLAEKGIRACQGGVRRVHILDYRDPDALLTELFTRDGCGTLINADSYETSRAAKIHDIGGINELIAPLQANGTLAPRTQEQLELDIDRFQVIERDGMIIACAALFLHPEAQTAEIACLVTHPEYRNGGRADTLLKVLEQNARQSGATSVFVLTTRTGHWFLEQGFAEADIARLPIARQAVMNPARNSKILVKTL